MNFIQRCSKVAPALVLGVAACGGSSMPPQPNAPSQTYGEQTPTPPRQYGAAMGQPNNVGGPETNPAPTNPTPPPPATPSMGATSEMGAPSGTMDVSALSDAQLAAVVKAIVRGEMEEAQLAESKATSKEVKDFARLMVRDHRDMLDKQTSSLQRLQIVPSENAVSNSLSSTVQTQISQLQSMRGRELDTMFIDDMIRDHNKALEMLDRVIPSIKNGEMKADVEKVRPRVESHLREAERIQATMQRGQPSRQRP